jgi:two-component system OmpR family response regulator
MGVWLCIAVYGVKFALYLKVSMELADMPIYKLLSSFLCRVAIILGTSGTYQLPGIARIEYFVIHH